MVKELPKSLDQVESKTIECDLLIVGGGNAGCFAAYEAKQINPDLNVVIMEKANIKRSGACAAGMDALNTYIPTWEGKTPEDLVRWSRSQVGGGPLREDLALSNARELNQCVEELEEWGLPILYDEGDEHPRYRGAWDISIHGEQLKPIMAEKAMESAEVYNRIVATSLIIDGNRCVGAMGFGVRDGKFYAFKAKATIVSTGGACGIYKSYTSDGTASHQQTWMCPFNVGSGYAMGLRKGAEFTSMEQRWVAARTKDYCGPVDTVSVGYKAKMMNAKGEYFLNERYAHLGGDKAPRYIRANAPMEEWRDGRGPTYVDSTHLDDDACKNMLTDYLNERPSFVLYLAANGVNPTEQPVEVYGSDPYIVGGHTGSGFWVDIERMTTIPGLFAAGETAGGNPNKFVGGCAAEGKLATRGAVKFIEANGVVNIDEAQLEAEKARIFNPLFREEGFDGLTPEEVKERLQRLMDEYAGGTSQFYRCNEEQLDYALKHIKLLQEQSKEYLMASDMHELMHAHEVFDRIDVAEIVCHHLKGRKETRWNGWQTRTDFPERDDANFNCFVESRKNLETGEIEVFTRPYERIIED